MIGSYIDNVIEELKHPSIGDWRNTGMLGCIKLIKNRDTKESLSEWNEPLSQPMIQVKTKLRELGIFTFVKWNFIFVAPLLTIAEAEIDEGVDIISQALQLADQSCC